MPPERRSTFCSVGIFSKTNEYCSISVQILKAGCAPREKYKVFESIFLMTY